MTRLAAGDGNESAAKSGFFLPSANLPPLATPFDFPDSSPNSSSLSFSSTSSN